MEQAVDRQDSHLQAGFEPNRKAEAFKDDNKICNDPAGRLVLIQRPDDNTTFIRPMLRMRSCMPRLLYAKRWAEGGVIQARKKNRQSGRRLLKVAQGNDDTIMHVNWPRRRLHETLLTLVGKHLERLVLRLRYEQRRKHARQHEPRKNPE